MPRIAREAPEIDGSESTIIVTGSTLAAELFDRPIAYRLRDRVMGLLPRPRPDAVLVCSDVMYLSTDPVRARPTISIGSPQVSALAAYLAGKLPSLYVIDNVLMVQGDPEFDELLISCWGVTHDSTAAAVDAFAERYLTGFLAARGR
jgi:hypothetical protein